MKKIIIAIDGHSSCGKSTLAKQLAGALGYRFIDSGAMYRAVTLFFLNNQIDIYHLDAVADSLQNISIDFRWNPETGQQETFLNGENVENEIRVSTEIASVVSPVSAISEVRKFLVAQQQQMGAGKGIVMDGRDIGTVVFPEAELKIFLTADPKVRAKRRFDELIAKGRHTSFEDILANIRKRDTMDSNRADSPLRKAEDAVYLDNSHLTREQQLEFVLKLAKEKIGSVEI
ncbi:MAG: (d)CMP kinase [Bacteroidia bacterium]